MIDIVDRLSFDAIRCEVSFSKRVASNIEDGIAEIKRLRAQLPEGMKDCTILFKECEKGHGRLTATNWIDHGCGTCKVDRLDPLVMSGV